MDVDGGSQLTARDRTQMRDVPAVAMVLDKVQHVEDVFLNHAKQSQNEHHLDVVRV